MDRTRVPRETIARRTIADFGDQWSRYRRNDGYYGSIELLRDICTPLFDLEDLRSARVADVGSGTGRIVEMLLAAGAAHVIAIEPSDAFKVLRQHTAKVSDRVTLLYGTGDELPAGSHLDFVFVVGVLHHIPDPEPVLTAARAALKPGGRLVVWVYAVEGNERYLAVLRRLRSLTTRLPHAVLALLSHVLVWMLWGYMLAARVLLAPVKPYLAATFSKLTYANRQLVIYDQLRPTYAKYYLEAELRDLLVRCGFEGIEMHHRHGYSWTAVGRKVAAGAEVSVSRG